MKNTEKFVYFLLSLLSVFIIYIFRQKIGLLLQLPEDFFRPMFDEMSSFDKLLFISQIGVIVITLCRFVKWIRANYPRIWSNGERHTPSSTAARPCCKLVRDSPRTELAELRKEISETGKISTALSEEIAALRRELEVWFAEEMSS